MAVFGVGLCLSFFFVCIVSTSVVQGRNLRRRHNHHSHSDYYPNFEETIPRDLSKRAKDDPGYRQDIYDGQVETRESSRVLDRPESEYESRISSPPRRYKHVYDYYPWNYEEFARPRKDVLVDAPASFIVRGKRHSKHGGTVSYRNFSDQDRQELGMIRRHKQQFELLHTSPSGGLRASFELEVKEAQNSSICNYTVQSVPDPRGTRMPRDLEHVKCNHAGSSCQDIGAYCCIQTYRYIEVTYSDCEDRDTMKIYAGCVCALQDLNNGLSVVQSELSVDD